MKFCDNCQNMLYISVENDAAKSEQQAYKLTRKCKNCNFTIEEGITAECIVSSARGDTNVNYKKYMSKYIKFDPTLPRVNNIKCANADKCTKAATQDDEIIYIKYDHINMKYLYMCCHCDHFWK